MPSTAIKKIRGKINKVGIFVDEDADELLQTVDDCGLYLFSCMAMNHRATAKKFQIT